MNAMTVQDVCALLFVLIGIGLLLSAVWDMCLAAESSDWPQAEGTILESRLETENGPEGAAYRPQVRYRYFIDGAPMIGTRACFGDRLLVSWSAPARRIVRTYPPETTVSVHYDPDYPYDSVLEPGVNALLIFQAAFGAVFAAFGAFFVIRG
jgi:hypothetical protein